MNVTRASSSQTIGSGNGAGDGSPASPVHMPRSSISARMPRTSRSPISRLMRMATSISTTMQGVPRELSVWLSVACMTVAEGWTHTKSSPSRRA